MSQPSCITHLEGLIRCDTQNPPRRIDGDAEIFRICAAALDDGFTITTWDHGDGHVSWYAVKGSPSVLFNVHLDTVPAGDGWSSDPLKLQIRDDRAYGRGVCDIKGAAAALLDLASQGVPNMAMLFTTDEEGAGGCCVERFLQTGEQDRFKQIIIAEPTQCRAIFAHRGFLSVKTRFAGIPGHSSEARALQDNAIHQMAQWAAAALDVARARKAGPDDPGSCFNMGVVKAGSKSNVIAGDAFVHWSARLAPGDSNEEFLDQIRDCSPSGARVDWEVPFSGQPLPANGQSSAAAESFCARHGLDTGKPVNFWTEAALFSAAGLPSLVMGPGDIAQAHATDEWVELSQLERAYNAYKTVVINDG